LSQISKRARLTLFEHEATVKGGGGTLTAILQMALVLSLFCCMTQGGYGQDVRGAACGLKGTVFIGDPGSESYIANARVLVSGPVMAITETDQDGKYTFDNVPPGAYTVEANFETLKAELSIKLEPNQLVELPIQLTLAQIKQSVTVTATESTSVSPNPADTINEKTVNDAPNVNEQFQGLLPLVPGVVRGPDGLVNLKGTRSTQSGALVNSANVTDPATGSPAISLPIDVVSSVKVISDPYDPEYGKLTGAVSNVETKTGDFDGYHFSIQNVLPRPRVRDGSFVGVESATPRMTFTGPLIKDRVAVTESFEYRFIRTPVNSLPPLQRDMKLEGFNWYSQYDLTISPKQTATVSIAVYPQKLDYLGLNTFTPQPSTGDFHQRGYQIYGQDHYLLGPDNVLTSQLSFKRYDVDVTAQNNDPFQLLVDTTQGGFFNRQSRRSTRFDWQEIYQMAPKQFLGSHQVKLGLEYAHSSYSGRETFLPAELIGTDNLPIERLTFTQPTSFNTDQNEITWFVGDQWSLSHRVTLDLGLRFDSDTVTSSTHAAPRLGFVLALTNDGKTLLKGGIGIFYDRVPLIYPVFDEMPDRTVTLLGPNGQALGSTAYTNRIGGELQNPRSTAWNVALERQVSEHFTLRLAYEQRNTARDFVVSPSAGYGTGSITLSNAGTDSYREFQITGRYRLPRMMLDASYIHSRAYGDLNDPQLFFGNYPQAVIQPDALGRLSFDAPNRVLLHADIEGPWKLTIVPVFDIHTGFPYSVENEYRQYIGARNVERFPRFSSLDLQISRPISLPFGERHIQARIGGGVFNLFGRFNPRDVQNDIASTNFGKFYNSPALLFRGKLVFQF